MAGGLRTATDEFLRELLVVELTLEKVARSLESEFSNRFSSTGVNPLSLMKRIQSLQREMPELRADCQVLIQRKQELIDTAKQQLSTNRARLHHLCTASGMQPPDDSHIHSAFKQALQEWDAQVAVQNTDLLEQPETLDRAALNRALAGSMLQ